MVQASQQRLIDILDYWHKIEFFIPFDLDQVTDVEDEWKLRWIKPQQLAAWSSTSFPRFDIPADRRITGFRLYLGVFDRSEIATVCKHVLPESAGGNEEEERVEMEGRTCFVRLDLNAHGEPVFDPVSVSTVPWAMGRAMSHGIESLGSAAFDAARLSLIDLLKDFRTRRPPAKPVEPGGAPLAVLTGAEIDTLSTLLNEWAGFAPAPGHPLLLEAVTAKKKDKEDGKEKSIDKKEEDEEPDPPSIDILNSFYIEDIERAMQAMRSGQAPLLASYLTPLAQDQRVDVYTAEGRRALLDRLHPDRCNRGHWLSQSSHSMSLMQQFAINAGLESVREGGMFAVNGPPGTGKTTLLREIFADNIVRRAAALAALPTAGDAFSGRRKILFQNGQFAWTGVLKPELSGFEMVVASSNNAAVENISRDLPKLKSLGEDWRQTGYLRSVAYRIAAEDEKGVFHPSPEIAPWGLISCALGNSDNRRRFISKFYHNNWNDEVEPNPDCQNIRDWALAYTGPGFTEAAGAYRALAVKTEQAIAAMADYATLWRRHLGIDAARFSEPEHTALLSAQALAEQGRREHDIAQRRLNMLMERQADLREEERLLDRQRPGFLARCFQRASVRQHRDECVANAGAQRELLRETGKAKTELASCAASLERQAEAVDAARAAWRLSVDTWEAQQLRLARYREQYAFELPASADALEQDSFQITGLWHDQAMASLRSELFAASLALHEAWLAEALKKDGGFGGNLFALSLLLTNKRPDSDADIALIWQSLFMAVPVVSTTFASLARQFRGMGSGSIGWLFIDEAGQAVPQAAVGGLLRARRAVVVGDPLQIEPVFTVPLSLIRAFSAQSPHTADEAYAPDKVSVQRLADNANRYGTRVPLPGGDGLWIGSPLRVHRRCADPMFSLANAIAYDGKMVIEPQRRIPSPLKVAMGPSAWIDITGPASFKQVVPEQIDFVAALIVELYQQGGALPDLYVISPFKAVRNAVRKRIGEVAWPGKPPSKKAVHNWCKQSVGTVHTFQGKEQAAVLMVLGVDAEHAGSATWAASKPNLLNVALTRAQQNFYMAGSAEVWREEPYFGAAYAKLPLCTAAHFMQRVGVAETSGIQN